MSEHSRSVADYLLGGLSLEEYRERERERDAAAMRARWAQEEAEEERRRLRSPRARLRAAAPTGVLNSLRNGRLTITGLDREHTQDVAALRAEVQKLLDATQRLSEADAARVEAALRAEMDRLRPQLEPLERARGHELTLDDLPPDILRALIEALGGALGRAGVLLPVAIARIPSEDFIDFSQESPILRVLVDSLVRVDHALQTYNISIDHVGQRLHLVWSFWFDWRELKETIKSVVERVRRLIHIARSALEPLGKWVDRILCLVSLQESLENLERTLNNAQFPDDADRVVEAVASLVASITTCIARFSGNVLVDFVLSHVVGAVVEALGRLLGDILRESAAAQGEDERSRAKQREREQQAEDLDRARQSLQPREEIPIKGGTAVLHLGSSDENETAVLHLIIINFEKEERMRPCQNARLHFFAPPEHRGKQFSKFDHDQIQKTVLECIHELDERGLVKNFAVKVEVDNVTVLYQSDPNDDGIRCVAGWYTTGLGSMNKSSPFKC